MQSKQALFYKIFATNGLWHRIEMFDITSQPISLLETKLQGLIHVCIQLQFKLDKHHNMSRLGIYASIHASFEKVSEEQEVVHN